MNYILVNHKVKSFESWKPFFDNDIPEQKKAGINLNKVFLAANNKNDVFILFETSDLDKATAFFTNPRLKDLMHTAGVVSEPDVKILQAV